MVASGVRGLFQTSAIMFGDRPLTPEVTRALIGHGPCQPGLMDKYDKFPYDQEVRRFNPACYGRHLGVSGNMEQQWLIYSPGTNELFCCFCFRQVQQVNLITSIVVLLEARFRVNPG